MAGERTHIVRSYENEIERLRELMAEMAALVETQLELAMRAIIDGDGDAADEASRMDKKVDQLERDVEGMAIRLLALRSPLGADLREIVAAFKITDGLERMGDYAASIARRSLKIRGRENSISLSGLRIMGRLVSENLHRTIGAMANRNPNEAMAVWNADQIIDEYYTAYFRELITYMMEDPRHIKSCTELLFVAKNLERIGDHATNVAERVFYAVTGENLPTQRPMGVADRKQGKRAAGAKGEKKNKNAGNGEAGQEEGEPD